jgi:hypothetical protein
MPFANKQGPKAKHKPIFVIPCSIWTLKMEGNGVAGHGILTLAALLPHTFPLHSALLQTMDST